MRWFALLLLSLVTAVGLLWAADDKAPDKAVKGLVVHEWGVWRVHDDMQLANADMRATWNELPSFMYGQTSTRDFPKYLDRPTRVKKPVLFFHAPLAMQVEVRVDFPGGIPAVWWPATYNPAYHDDGFRGVERTTPEKPAKYLEWKLHLQKPIVQGTVPQEVKPVDQKHWIKTLRDVDCDDVYAPVGELNSAMEHERFVYYDGLLPAVKALSIKVEKEKARLTNQAKYAVFDIWVIDKRNTQQPRIGRLPRLDAGAAQDVELTATKGDGWAEDAGKTLTTQLKEAGLNQDEAASLTTIWAPEFFHSPCVTLLYRLPQEEYDRLLPLSVKPQPEKIVRVGLIQQIPFDSEFADRIAKLVKQLDDDAFARREAAQQELTQLGAVGFGYLRRLQPTITAPEPKRRVEQLLEKYDAEHSIKK
jgi:hypothetical protein